MGKYCGKCGSKLDEATGLCPNCDSAEIKKHYDKQAPNEISTQNTNINPEQEGTSRRRVPRDRKANKRNNKRMKKARKKAAKKEKERTGLLARRSAGFS